MVTAELLYILDYMAVGNSPHVSFTNLTVAEIRWIIPELHLKCQFYCYFLKGKVLFLFLRRTNFIKMKVTQNFVTLLSFPLVIYKHVPI